MTLPYIGKITPKTKEMLNESIIVLKWNDPSLDNIIFNRKCPKCKNKLLYADNWDDTNQVVIFKRLCPACKRIFILAGCFDNYNKVKAFFIRRFRLKLNMENNYRNY